MGEDTEGSKVIYDSPLNQICCGLISCIALLAFLMVSGILYFTSGDIDPQYIHSHSHSHTHMYEHTVSNNGKKSQTVSKTTQIPEYLSATQTNRHMFNSHVAKHKHEHTNRHNNRHGDKSRFESNNLKFDDLLIPPTIPSFVILGPAKTGTTSICDNLDEYVDIVYYGQEHHYWASCKHRVTIQEWTHFLNDFRYTQNIIQGVTTLQKSLYLLHFACNFDTN